MKFLKRWLSDAQPVRAHTPARPRRLTVENLEDRTVPAITIADVSGAQGPVQSGNPSTFAGGYDPQALVNPVRPNQIIAVFTTGNTLQFQVSDDYGTNWYGQSAGITMRTDPLSWTPQFGYQTLTNVDTPSIAFDRTDHFYVSYIQRNAANTAGAVMVEKYQLIRDSLTGRWNVRNQSALGQATTHVLYQWAGQDPAFNTTIAVNTDSPTYTDPVTGAIQTNLTAGRGVYVAWNTNAAQTAFPNNTTFGFAVNTTITPATVWTTLSDDGGVTFSTPQPVTNGGYNGGTGINPTIYFSPSTATQAPGVGGTSGGQLNFLFSNGGGLSQDRSDPFAGRNVANPLTVQPTGAAPTGGSTKPGVFQSNLSGTVVGGGAVTLGTIAPAVAPTDGVLTARVTEFPITVDMTTNRTATAFDFLNDMELTLALYSQDLSQMRIELVAPNNLGTVTLLADRQFLDNAGALQTRDVRNDGSQAGLPSNNPRTLGATLYPTGDTNNPWEVRTFGLVFDQEAARFVNDPRNDDVNEFYIMRVKPEDNNIGPGFRRFYGLSAAQLTGDWKLRITNHKENDTGDPTPPGPRLLQYELKFVARVDTNGFGADGGTGATTSATTAGLTGTPTTALATAGLQGWYSVAVDDSKGSFSPFQGRVYLATSDGTNVFVRRSLDGGLTWAGTSQVNDDSATDGFSGGNRAKFQPTVTVDSTTGTVVVMWYDARWDASNGRPATFIATSVDGGVTWSPNTFLNETKTAIDAFNGNTVKIEPVPNNLATLASIGNGQALLARNGVVVPLWTGNANAGGASLMTAATRVGAGARIVQGDMGPVSDSFLPPGFNGTVSYNDTFTLDGTRQLDAFYLKFDRRVDPTTFTTADVRLQYQDTIGGAPQDISGQILSVQALDPISADSIYGATRFLVRMTPQSRVGTYSYAIRGDINDRVREVYTTSAQPSTEFPPTIANSNTIFASTLDITGQAPVAISTLTVTVDLSNFSGFGGNNMDARDLILRLKGPNGTVATLARQNGGTSQAGTVYSLTTFDDAATPIGAAGTPYNNVAPIDNLMAAFGALTDINGTWTLEAVNVTTGQRTRLEAWALNVNGTAFNRTYTTATRPTISASPRATSDVIVSGFATNTTLNSVQVRVDFADPALNGAKASDLLLRLRGPNPNDPRPFPQTGYRNTTITLAYANGGAGTAGAVYNLTTFDSAAAQSIATAGTPFGTVRPLTSLLTTFGGVAYDPNGTWRLEVYNMATGVTSTLQMNTWSLTLNGTSFQPGFPVDIPGQASFGQSITVANEPPVSLSNISVAVEFIDPTTNPALDNEVQVTLTGPDGAGGITTINLVNANGTGTKTAGGAYRYTVFQEGAGIPLVGTQSGAASVVRPVDSLMAAFGGLTDINGTWTIDAINLSTGNTLRFNNWQIVFQSTAATGNKVDQNGNGIENEGGDILGGTSGRSTILVSGQPAPVGAPDVRVAVKFADPLTTPANAADVKLELTGPNGTTITLADGHGTGTAGTAFGNVTFDDNGTPIGVATSPFGTVRPPFAAAPPLPGALTTAFGGLASVNGAWTLTATNRSTGRVLRLDTWSITFNGRKLGDSSHDVFANPTPVGGRPFVLPYTIDSLPLIIPGPRVVSSTPTFAADGTVSFIDVVFDKDMMASSFTPAQVLELRLPTGLTVNGPFTVTPNPAGTAPLMANRTFRVGFPTQSLSGSYSLLLGPGIKSATGLSMDPNMNAGVELVTGRVTNPNVAGTVSNNYNTGTVGLVVPVATNATTPGVATSSLTITDPFVITQLLTTPIKLRLDVSIADVRNLTAQLLAPDGTVVQLFANVGDQGVTNFTNFTGTEFSDFAPLANLIQNAAAPFTGTFLPQQPLSVLNGKTAGGNWTLRLVNKSLTDTATLNFWGLSLPQAVLGNGLGEPVLDQTTVGFRIFTSSPGVAQSTTAWTPLGPTTSTDRGDGVTSNGKVTVTAVDPSDPSGNTVYAGGANGGLWKTTNFLTLDPAGPTWIPLLDAASAKAMHVSSITILPRNNDPSQQSIILVGTGDADTRVGGVGFLRSTDGGRTFRLIDSTVNADANTTILPVNDPARDHVFSNNLTYVYKVVVDPVRLFNGEFVVYAALGGSAATQGLWRSVDSGRTWGRIRGGADATDFVLAPNRVDVVNGSPTLRTADIAYAAFAGQGVFFSSEISVASSLTQLNGGVGKPLFSNGSNILGVGNPGVNPGIPFRILLAAAPTPPGNDPLAIRNYQGWLYALVAGGGQTALYMTKDFGSNWTRVDLSYLTNDETQQAFDFGIDQPTGLPVFNALAVDPTDPNVVYIGGNNVIRTANGTLYNWTGDGDPAYQFSSTRGIYRVDVSTLSDAHAQVGGDNSKGGVGAQTEGASAGGLLGGPTRVVLNPTTGLTANNSAYFNRFRDPNQPFVTGATQIIQGQIDTNIGGSPGFTNTGENAQISQFYGVAADNLIRNIETLFDPLTRKTRLLISTERGVYTAVDGANPLPTQGIYANAQSVTALGSATVVAGNRSSNLALTDITQTALQPSLLASDLAGLYNRQLRDNTNTPLPSNQQNSVPGQWLYTVSEDGYLNAPGGVLTTGSNQYASQTWTGEVNDTAYLRFSRQDREWATPGYTLTDPQGSGIIYQYRTLATARTAGGAAVNGSGDSTDIFTVTLPGQRPIGRSNGLFQAGDGFDNNGHWQGQWTSTDRTAFFAVNQADANGIIISSPGTGQVFLTTDQGVNWFAKGTPATFGNSQGTALAFGGRDSSKPSANTFFYNGTAAGRVFVTLDGGSSWTNISTGLPAGAAARPILKIIANPRAGDSTNASANTFSAYLVTAAGVFFCAETRPGLFTGWTDITGNLFALSKPVFGETVTTPILTELTALQVDWRYAVPVLYAGGDTGVFRSQDGGVNWELFPANLGTTTTADDGGYLPNARVTDLDLVYGDLNSSGLPVQSGGRNILVASTYGRGLFAIRLSTADVPAGLGNSGPFVNSAPLTAPNVVTGAASITLNFGDGTNPVRVDVSTLAPNMSLVGPNGAVPFTVTDISTTTNGVSLSNTFRLDFTPPVSGTYTLNMNTNVRDLSGRPLNQNRNGTNGEVPADWFIQQYNVTVNQAPTITAVPNQGLLVNASTAALPFTVGDFETAAGSLVVTRTSSDTAVVPLADVVLLGSGANRTVTVTGRAAGTSVITLTVTDGSNRQTSTSFTVSVVVAPAIPFSDNFNRPDAGNLGGQWVVETGTAVGSFNSALATSPLTVATVNGVSQLNSVTQATVALSNSSLTGGALVARYSGAAATASMYYGGMFLENGAATARIYRQVNGVATELARSASLLLSPQYLVRFEVINDSLKLFVGGTLATFAYDTALTASGLTGIRFNSGNRIDDFSADNIALNAPAPLPPVPGTTTADTFTLANGSQLTRDWRDRSGNLSVTGNTAVGNATTTASLSTLNIVQPAVNAGAQADVSVATVGRVAGIVLRYTGTPGAADTNYYLGQLRNTATGTVAQLFRNLNGAFTPLGEVAVAGTGGTLRFEANGPSLKLFLNGVRVLTAYDTALTAAGGVGLRTNQGGTADNFQAFALGTNAALPFGPDTFNAGGLNQLGSVWTERAGAVSLAGSNARGTVAGANFATLNGVSAANVVVTGVAQAHTGAAPTAIQLVARYQANGDYYLGMLNAYPAGGPNPNPYYLAEIWKVVGGVPMPLNTNAVPIVPASVVGQTLRFEVLGSSLRFYVNDVLRAFTQDTSIAGAGSVGIRLGNGAGVDDFTAAVRAPSTPTVPGFLDNFNTTNAQSSLSTDWQERSGFYNVPAGTNRAVGGSASLPNTATLNGVNVANATIDGTFFFTAANQTAGLVGRYTGTGGTGDSNMYFAAFTPQTNGDALIRIMRNVGGTWTTLATTTLTGYFPGAVFTAANPIFRFVLNGNALSVFVDGIQRLTVNDTSLTTGSVGMRAGQGAGIDNFAAN